jgi:hypothetical protein
MKKIVLWVIFSPALLLCKGQDCEKHFQIGLGIEGGTLAYCTGGSMHIAPNTFSAGLALQVEYPICSMISGFASTNYNLLLVNPGEASQNGESTANFISLLAGPRIYLVKKAFFGVGLGYGIITAQGSSRGGFSCEPQIGLNLRSTEIMLAYNAISYSGYAIGNVNVKLIIKL